MFHATQYLNTSDFISAEVPNEDILQTVMQVNPDDQQVFYSLIGENGQADGEYLLICPKAWDQATLVEYLVEQVKSDPNSRGNITIEIRTPLLTVILFRGGIRQLILSPLLAKQVER